MNLKRSVAVLCALSSLTAAAGQETAFFAACQGKAASVGCSVELSDGIHEGVCRTDDLYRTACMPRDSPPPPAAEAKTAPPSVPQHAAGAK